MGTPATGLRILKVRVDTDDPAMLAILSVVDGGPLDPKRQRSRQRAGRKGEMLRRLLVAGYAALYGPLPSHIEQRVDAVQDAGRVRDQTPARQLLDALPSNGSGVVDVAPAMTQPVGTVDPPNGNGAQPRAVKPPAINLDALFGHERGRAGQT